MEQLCHHGIFNAWEALRVILPHIYKGTILLKQFLQAFNWNLQQYKGIFLHRIFREPAPKLSRWTNWDVRTMVRRVGHYLDGLVNCSRAGQISSNSAWTPSANRNRRESKLLNKVDSFCLLSPENGIEDLHFNNTGFRIQQNGDSKFPSGCPTTAPSLEILSQQ